MSNYAHIPWAIGITIVCIAMHLIGVPASFIGATGGSGVCICREITQAEYYREIPEVGGIRANMKWWAGFRFWRWNEHSKTETVLAIAAAYATALLIHLATGL